MSVTVQTNSTPVSRSRIVAAFLAIYVIWGTTFLAIRIAVETIPAFMMAGLRFLLAGGVMLLVLLARGGSFPTLRHWRSAVIAGGLMLVTGIGLVSFAEQRIPSALAALMVATNPIWICLFEWLIFRGKRPGIQTLVGLAFGFAGAVLLFAPALRTDSGHNDLVGMAIVAVGAISFALGSLYSRRAVLPEDGRMSTAIEMTAGGVLLLILSVLTGEPARLNVAAVSTRSLLALAYLIVFGSIIAYTAYLWLLKTVEPAKVSTNFYVNPVIAVFAGWLLGGEEVTVQMLIATAVILLGVAVINIKLPSRDRAVQGSSGVDDAYGQVKERQTTS